MIENIWQQIYDSFPINREMIWLNNCGVTSPSTRVLTDVDEFMKGYAREGIFTTVRNMEQTSANIKKILSDLLVCSPDELALTHNTSEGMNLISYGMNLEKGDIILLLQNEYPSNVYPWEHWEKKGVEIRFVDAGKSPREFLGNFESMIVPRVRLAALSTVHWCTGMPLPLKDISRLCEAHRIELVLDGAQGVGHVDIDLSELNLLAMAFSSWKWLLGPVGLGVLYVNQKKIDSLEYVFKGQNSVMDSDNYLPYKHTLKPGAARYEYSTPAFLEWVYFESSLTMLAETGFDNVKRRIFELSQYLQTNLGKNGFRLASSEFENARTGIVVFDSAGRSSEEIAEILKENRVAAAVRLDRIRLSPHIYNSIEQLDRVISLLIK